MGRFRLLLLERRFLRLFPLGLRALLHLEALCIRKYIGVDSRLQEALKNIRQ
jgi:hypothetical protein